MKRRWFILLAAGAVALLWLLLAQPAWLATLGVMLSSESLAVVAARLREFGVWTPLASMAFMVAQAVIAPLPGTLIAAANGVLFGIWWGALLSWLGAMAGASTAFWLARGLGRGLVTRHVPASALVRIDTLGEAQGFWIVLVARLIPLVSLDFIGYLAGLSRMRFRHYLLANALGLAPGMVAYTVLGHDLALARDSLWRVALIVLGFVLLFLVGRHWLRRRGLVT